MYGFKEWIGLVLPGIFVTLVVGRVLAIIINLKFGSLRIFNNGVVSFAFSLFLPFLGYRVMINLAPEFFQRHMLFVFVTLSLLLGLPNHIHDVQKKNR